MTTTPAPVSGEGGVDAYAKLAQLGLTLPQVVPPLAAYVPAVQSGNYVYVSGQLPLVDGKLPKAGRVGAEVTPEEAAELAKICGLNALAAIEALVGLGRLVKIVKVTGFVASAPGFTGQPLVVNGASNLFGEVLGEQGRHARSAVGVAELPLGAPVEVEVIAEVA
ncbi:RidA family protein [Actinoplanes sp. GCM10030250]|uniref:RidA family protein n=1 Tax=Actinoplanes sp. GCM10030250 TaxID=3273376 RepID=UPI00361A07D5